MLELQLGLRTNNSGVVAFNALKRAVYTLLCADTMVCFKDNHPKTIAMVSSCMYIRDQSYITSQCLDGQEVAFQVLMPEDSGSNPEAGSIYFIRRSLSWFGLASTPAESLPNLNPAFLLSASRPFNRWPLSMVWQYAVWYSMRLHGLEGDFQWW